MSAVLRYVKLCGPDGREWMGYWHGWGDDDSSWVTYIPSLTYFRDHIFIAPSGVQKEVEHVTTSLIEAFEARKHVCLVPFN
jgi:hypothetical protein